MCDCNKLYLTNYLLVVRATVFQTRTQLAWIPPSGVVLQKLENMYVAENDTEVYRMYKYVYVKVPKVRS